jgi:hypothetical protein
MVALTVIFARFWRVLSFLRALLDGASLAVIRSGQGDAWGCAGPPVVLLDPPFGAGSDRWGRRNPIGFSVGVGEVCGLLADGHR